ncbi:unnamed protein product, partial [marine sediment metagenome]
EAKAMGIAISSHLEQRRVSERMVKKCEAVLKVDGYDAQIKEIRASLENSLDFDLPQGIEEKIAEELKVPKAEHEFNKIIKFITGRDPEKATEEERKKEGSEKCLALVYEGENAIQKIRKVLGETNPEDAAPGTVRKDFGYNVIKNGAHASDSVSSAEREMRIIQIEKDDIARIVKKYY